ncbi:MAG: DUF1287 domain-containing protein [Burkholderiales bacterium]|nr:DUF1287 domain-containing protein [Burkholderiales bacterium]
MPASAPTGLPSVSFVRLILTVLFACIAFAEVRAEDPLAILLDGARAQIGVTVHYDPAYRRLDYPGGDVTPERGVCTDVVIRAYRRLGVDLQVLVHEDMRKNWNGYPRLWGASKPDRNIDHRRVPNLAAFLRRQGAALPVTTNPRDYRPGDIVTWRLTSGVPHIGLVSDTCSGGRPRVIHNIGAGTVDEDMLFDYVITGHFRYGLQGTTTTRPPCSR